MVLKASRNPGDPHNKIAFFDIVKKTYDMNPTPSKRKYTLEQYCLMIEPLLDNGTYQLY